MPVTPTLYNVGQSLSSAWATEWDPDSNQPINQLIKRTRTKLRKQISNGKKS